MLHQHVFAGQHVPVGRDPSRHVLTEMSAHETVEHPAGGSIDWMVVISPGPALERLPPGSNCEGNRTVLQSRRITVVLPAYNAARTLRATFNEIPHEIVDDILLVDDGSTDDTIEVARSLGIHTLRHERNRGYGANQKTCYAAALERGADIVVMLHPDYQYAPRLVTAMASMIVSGHYDVVLGSRILGGGALAGGMPKYKYFFNRLLTLIQNILMAQKLSEFHTGYRAWSRTVLERLPIQLCSNDFVFDNQMLAQAVWFGFRIGEISCPTKYFPEASSINFTRSMVYGIGVLTTSIQYLAHRLGLHHSRLFTLPGEANTDAPNLGPAVDVP